MKKKKDVSTFPLLSTEYIHIFLYLFFFSFNLKSNLHSALVSGGVSLEVGEQVGNVIPRMPVETGPESLLVKVMGNQTNGTSEDKETVKHTHL